MSRGESSRSGPMSVPSMSSASMRIGNAASGRTRGRWSLTTPAVTAPPARRRPAVGAGGSTRASRGSPARSACTRQRQPGRIAGDRRHDRLALVRADLEQRDPVRRRATRAGARAGAGSSSSPSAPAVEREPRLEREVRRAGRPCRRRARTAGWRRSTAYGGVADRAAGRPSRNAIRSATPWPTAFSRARSSASGEMSTATTVTWASIRRFRRAATSETAIAPVPVPTSAIRSGGVPAAGVPPPGAP